MAALMGLDETLTGSGEDRILVDHRYYPLLTSRWVGMPTEKLIHDYYAYRKPWTDRAHSEGRAIITVNDMDEMRAPPATTRKYASDLASMDTVTPGFSHQVNIVTNSLVRGVLTAVLWVGGKDKIRIVYAHGWADGIRKALAEFKALGHEIPTVDPDKYSFPVD